MAGRGGLAIWRDRARSFIDVLYKAQISGVYWAE
jgi:hypothetical protein